MTIIHLVPSVGPASGGMGSASLALLQAQNEAGLDTSVWCVDPPNVAATAAGGRLNVVSFPVAGPRRFAWSPACERRARTIAADVVHQHGLWTAQSNITRILRARGKPTVVAVHGALAPYARRLSPWKKRLALAAFERRNLRLASCLHATSEQELRDIREFGLREPVAVVPNALLMSWQTTSVDPESLKRRWGVEQGARIMLFLSRVHPIKGLPMLIDAIAANRDRLRDWRVVVAGPDANGHRNQIEAHAASAGLSDMVRFAGIVGDHEKRSVFAAADLFVLPTHTENFGIVVAEALSCGVPVITTHAAPWRELPIHMCGWWVPVSAASIGEALVDAASRTPDELREMGARGQSLIGSRYAPSTVAQRTISLYRWLRGDAARPDFVVMD